jgi:uncharacterized membrane protein
MKPSYLIRGFPGHPLHPPLTDATIGIYTLATLAALADVVGLVDRNAAIAWWIALVAGLVVTVPTALTGLVDWLAIERGTPLFRTATSHLIAMVSATVFFLLAALTGHGDYQDASVGTVPFVLTLVGFGLLTLGGWLGGSIVYVHGMRVLGLADEPARRAVTPGHEEKERAEGS